MELKPLFKDIADAIREKDGTADVITASTFPERIRAIPAGGGPADPLDPVEVYKATRPADWLPMPEPQDDEMYLLFHIPDGVSALLAFTVTCTGYYTVTIPRGTDFDQILFQGGSLGGREIELELNGYYNKTADGFAQLLVRITGSDIQTWEPSVHSKKTASSNFSNWNIVEIVCRLPRGTKVACGNSTPDRALSKLRYFTWYGANQATDMRYMFANCSSLTTVPQLDTAQVTDMSFMFHSCYSLTAVPQMDTAQVTNMKSMFISCNSLTAVPQLDTAQVTNMNGMFNYCYSLTAVPQLDTAQVTDMGFMFGGSSNLTTVLQLDTTQVTDMRFTFTGCISLNKLTFDPTAANWAGYAISLTNCSLGHTALVALFESLPTITSANTLTLTGNPGVSELTAAEKAIATGKNWTLTL